MLSSVGIHIKVRDFKRSCAFYQDLGFKKTFEYGPNKIVKEDYSGVVFELAVPPRHYYWGTIEVVIKDPDGTVLVFIAPYSLKEACKIKLDETFSARPKSS
jgi:catechol 2,3-dioxygenase-like lactoylglutathione lyase family enzyme